MPKRVNQRKGNHPKKVQKFAHEDQFQLVTYYFENGLRKVKPYVYEFECHAKGRWFGHKLLDVFKKEFRLETAEYYQTAIQEGLIKVNRRRASADRVLRNNDLLQSKVHRHEPPVCGQPIQILAETDDYLVINKPASIPVHPCGKYRHNTIVFILGSEHGYKGLHTIHRLDRLTSGLLLFARTLEVSHRLDAYVRDRVLEKTYLCKVEGEFPSEPVECKEPIFIVSHKIGVCRVKADGKPCHTRFERLSYDGESSIVKCYPYSGRMHQIRVHLQYLGFPISNDPLYNNAVWGASKGKGGTQLSDEELLSDLIEQHDTEIDSALQKARLQVMLTTKSKANPTPVEGCVGTEGNAIERRSQDPIPSRNGTPESADLDARTRKMDIGGESDSTPSPGADADARGRKSSPDAIPGGNGMSEGGDADARARKTNICGGGDSTPSLPSEDSPMKEKSKEGGQASVSTVMEDSGISGSSVDIAGLQGGDDRTSNRTEMILPDCNKRAKTPEREGKSRCDDMRAKDVDKITDPGSREDAMVQDIPPVICHKAGGDVSRNSSGSPSHPAAPGNETERSPCAATAASAATGAQPLQGMDAALGDEGSDPSRGNGDVESTDPSRGNGDVVPRGVTSTDPSLVSGKVTLDPSQRAVERSEVSEETNEKREDERTDKLAVSLCRECRNPMPDPEPHEMCIYLHALTYKGPGFEFSTPLPAWAAEHFARTGVTFSS